MRYSLPCVGFITLVAVSIAAAADAPESNGEFKPTLANRAPARGPVPAGMSWIPGGEFSMGSSDPTTGICGGTEPMVDARPVHRVYVDGFWMDATEVTNEAFARFVGATRYVTVAERKPRAEDFPSAPPESLVPGGVVFSPPEGAVPRDNVLAWWRYVPGADWRHPEGPQSDLRGREQHPVVQVAYEDAAAFAIWMGKRLPTEAEWEFAARGGLAGQPYTWGAELAPGGKWMANIFQGRFPHVNTAADGFAGTAPVASFPKNGYGLADMAGNVWEWCSDWYRPDSYERDVQAAGRANGVAVVRNPAGPVMSESVDPQEPGVAKRVQRGGSFLCTDQYCTRYMVGTRGKGASDTGSNHAGFRCVQTAK